MAQDLNRRRACLAGAAAGLLALSGCDKLTPAPKPVAFQGVDITGVDYAKRLSLADPDGQVRSLDEWKGKVVVVFFGYTQCPDVCPATLAELAEVKRALGADGDKVQGVFVSIDPERDTPALLKQYIGNFGPGFVALRGSPEETKAAAKEFKVFYGKVPGKAEGSYTMDHTAGSFLFDPQGRVRLFTRYGSGAQALAGDIKALLGGA